MTDELGTIYLLHASRPYVGAQSRPDAKVQTAQHYLGWAKHLEARIEHHHDGTGGNLCRVWKLHGITFTVVRTWTGTRSDERKLHNYKHNSHLCPVCMGGDPMPGPALKACEHAPIPF